MAGTHQLGVVVHDWATDETLYTASYLVQSCHPTHGVVTDRMVEEGHLALAPCPIVTLKAVSCDAIRPLHLPPHYLHLIRAQDAPHDHVALPIEEGLVIVGHAEVRPLATAGCTRACAA